MPDEPITKAKQLECLYWYDGPMVMLWEGDDGSKLLAVASPDEVVDTDELSLHCHYAAVVVTDDEWSEYLTKKRDMRSLFEGKTTGLYVSDRAVSLRDSEPINFLPGYQFEPGIRTVKVFDEYALRPLGLPSMPEKYMPSAGVWHSLELSDV